MISEIYTYFPIRRIASKNYSFRKFSKPIFAYEYYETYRKNLLTGEIEEYNINNWLTELSFIKFDHVTYERRVIHLFYELGQRKLQKLPCGKDLLLAIDIQYLVDEIKVLPKIKKTIKFTKGKLPNFEDYKKDFNLGREELLAGNCYQFNLTYQFLNLFDKEALSPMDLIGKLWERGSSIGAYGHATYIPLAKKLYLSNSPECLFQIKKSLEGTELISMPIKGSLPCLGQENIPKVFEQFKNCLKNTSELNMISDLLRNDLNYIDRPRAIIIKKAAPLYVPGILHQYSLVKVKIGPSTNLRKIIESLFPGGSITGAPKKRVMNILDKLESVNRGFYCGSTIILDKYIEASSINIRSSVIDFSSGEMTYGAGGGITLQSECRSEYDEMLLKYFSFFSLFK